MVRGALGTEQALIPLDDDILLSGKILEDEEIVSNKGFDSIFEKGRR